MRYLCVAMPTGREAFSYRKVDTESLTCATILVHAVHTKARQTLTSLRWLERTEKRFFTLSRQGIEPTVKLLSLDHQRSAITTELLYGVGKEIPIAQRKLRLTALSLLMQDKTRTQHHGSYNAFVYPANGTSETENVASSSFCVHRCLQR